MAVGDVVGVSDIIVATGPGGRPHLHILSGADRAQVYSFDAFEANFTGGVFVAAGDVNGDGAADIMVGAGAQAGRTCEGIQRTGRFDCAGDFFAFDTAFNGGSPSQPVT